VLLGIDEAGRGSVLGSLVICGFAVPASRLRELEGLGLRDSKRLSPVRRTELAGVLRRFGGRRFVHRLRAREVDAAVANGGLNAAEIRGFVRLIVRARPRVAYLDALTSRPDRFGRQVGALAGLPDLRIVAENRADGTYAVVQAASILAKVTRDAELDRLRRRWGALGSGYPSDPVTRAYLLRALRAGDLPPFVRRSWGTLDTVAAPVDARPMPALR
jgi:ribonuclease HII